MDIEKELKEEVVQITKDFDKLIPDNILELLIKYSLSFLMAILIFVIGKWFASKVVKILGTVLKKAGVESTLVRFLQNIVYYVLITVIVLAALNKIGVETTSFIAILGAAGLAVGLALKDSLNNFASGVMIILFRPFKAGDSVNAGGVSGTVTEVTIFNTVFLTADNQRIIVPNGAITKGSITNVNANSTRRVDLVIGISYEDNIKKVKEILTNIINNNPKILLDKPVSINVAELADFSVNLSINVWVNTGDYGSVKAELLETIKTTFDEVGISIPYPKQDVYQYSKN
ncbi:small conductance mechanosensitive channel protein [Aliarcobacter faecis]|uniref:mechanosensitive ion channel family protein n=1 Tax=Aliarcobacter faecis TaxID=1564138 RepID=UPI0004B9E199|nr:mechanosensitive ion channel domain-containing protein [Aliarcobacter faecis]QKF73980.1 small conductance mechanosensitive channel protein [Aliarcobacter faecis]